MAEEQFSPEESIRLIQSMIHKTKQDISDNSIHFLVWGWITLIACTAQFILKHIVQSDQHYQVWWIIIVGIAFSIYTGIREERTRKSKSYVDDSIRYLWTGMGLAYFVLSMILTSYGWDKIVFPFFIMLYGLGTFISGKIIQFKPLVVGGIIALGLAIGAAYVEYDYQMLIAATAILVSYIIPAYMLRHRNRSIHH